MKIYVTHSSDFDYQTDLYDVLKKSELYNHHEFYFPHDGDIKNTKEEIKNSDIIIAHISGASIGQGIELGWAENFGKRIIAVHHSHTQVSSSIRFITKEIVDFTNGEDMIKKLTDLL